VGPPTGYSKEWLALKERGGMDLAFPNLPHWIESTGVRLSHTHAILTYLADRHDLTGRTLQSAGERSWPWNRCATGSIISWT